MKTTFALLFALAPLLPAGTTDAVPACATVDNAVAQEALVADVLALYAALPYYAYPRMLAQHEDAEVMTVFAKSVEKIRSLVARLRQLPPEEVKAACLLAHSVLEQREWLYAVYLGEFGYAFEAPDNVGLLAVSILFEDVLRYLQPQSGISPAVRRTLDSFAAACGGVQTMQTVASWADEVPPDQDIDREYQAALSFFKDFCAAVSTENEELCLLRLAVLSRELQQLCLAGNAARLRVNYLVPTFRDALVEVWTEIYRSPMPYPNPVLPHAWRTDARMQALQPFFEQLPNLRTLVLDTATWNDASPTVAEPDYGASCAMADEVYGLEVLLNKQGEIRTLLLFGKKINADDLRMELEEVEDAELCVRLVLDRYADIHSSAVQELVQLCESCGVSKFLFAVRPADPLETTPTGEPCYFVDMVCRIPHPYYYAWVEYAARVEEPPSCSNTAGSGPIVRVRTPQGNTREYRSQNCFPSVLRIPQPWSPCGQYLLLPVSLHGGYLLVRVADLDCPDFDWSKATPIHARSAWQSPPIHSEPTWNIVNGELEIHFFSGMSGEAKGHCYKVKTGECTSQ